MRRAILACQRIGAVKIGSAKIGIILAIALSLTVLQPFALLAQTAQQSQPSVATGRSGAVASVDSRATQIGIDVLKAGGNAIDAAVATSAALGVVEPFSTGIGGGGFMLIYLKNQNRLIAIDGREQAPASASVDMFKDPDSPTGAPLPFMPNRISNGVAVGVPGTFLEWTEALNRYGTLPIAKVLQPAIALAKNGATVDATFVSQIAQNQARFAAFTSTQSLYLPRGKPPEVGTTFKNPDLAKTYQILADKGVNAFYRGEIGEAIVRTVQNPPVVANPPFRVLKGGMTMTDLDRYGIRVRPPTVTDYRGYKLYSINLPSSGGTTTGEVLNIVEGFDLGKLDRTKAWHSVIEAERLAYADRGAFLGDPEFVDVPLPGIQSKGFAQSRRSQIGDRAPAGGKDFHAAAGNPLPFQTDPSPSMTAAPPTVQASDPEGLSTTHLTISDRFGNVVSYTNTIESTGGSGIVVPGYGFLLNNELTDFEPASPHPNSPEPGKHPRSSISPTIAFAPDGTILAFGSPGGATIITTVLGIAVNLIDFGLPMNEAIAAPRISQRNGGVTEVDGGFETSDLGKALTGLGHVLSPIPEIGAATGIVMKPDGTLLAAAEPVRRGGGSAMTVAP
jgi:gamma-glutamyltranspeptidase / glutathione hydrolase